MTYTLTGIDPRLFNFASSVLSVIIEAILTLSIGLSYGILVNWYMSAGFQLPAAMFGDVPKNTFQATFRFLRNAHVTLPVIIIIALYACADFSKSIADLGLYFVTIEQEGDLQPVLSLYNDSRNVNHRLLQTAGDPLSFRTFVLPKRFYDEVQAKNDEIDVRSVLLDPNAHTLEETALTDSFLSAVEAIAVGDSPFAFASGSLDVNRTMKRFDGIDAWVTSRDIDTPLASIPLLIPLQCSSAEMVIIEQIQGIDVSTRLPEIQHVAHIPDCSVTENRTSGVYIDEDDDDEPEPVERAYILEYSYTTEAAHQSSLESYGVVNDGLVSKEIQLSEEDRELARDRQSWLEGRRVRDIEGIQFGDYRLNLESAFVASGPPLWIDGDSNDTSTWDVKYNYLLVGAVDGNCPPLQSGAADSALECMVFVELECDQFPEDVERQKGQFSRSDPTCKVGNMGMVWGRNFVADSTLASLVAGIYGRIKPHPFSYKHRAFMRNCIPAAMFALGTLEERLSVDTLVRAQINGVYIFFMIFPLLLSITLCATVCIRKDGRDVPRNPYHMLMLGKHCHDNLDIPNKTHGEFPRNCNRRLVLKRKFKQDGTEEDTLEIGHDFDRPLEDPFFRYLIKSRLRGKDEDFKNAWYRKKIYQGYEHDVSENHEKPSIRMVQDKILFGIAEKKLDDRLEFLEPHERAIWFGLDEIPKAKDDPEGQPSLPVPATFKNHCKTKAITKTSEHSTTHVSEHSRTPSHAIDGSSRAHYEDDDLHASYGSALVISCTEKRHKIRSEKEFCAVCLHNSASKQEEGGETVCHKDRKGCPGCQVVVCGEHWKDFDHTPSNWFFG